MQLQFFKQLKQTEQKLPWFSTCPLCQGCLLHAFFFLSLFIFSFQMEIDLKLCLCLIPIISTCTLKLLREVKELHVLQFSGVECARGPLSPCPGVFWWRQRAGRACHSSGTWAERGCCGLLPTQRCEGMISWSCWEFISHTNCHRKHFVKISKSK